MLSEQELFTTVRQALLDLLHAFDVLPDLRIVRSYNLVQAGRIEAPTVYMARVGSVKRGSPKDIAEYDREQKRMVYRNEQVVETKINFQAMTEQSKVCATRVADILSTVSQLLQTSKFIERLEKKGVQVLKIDSEQHTFIVNDQGEYEAVPLLTATFVYTNVMTMQDAAITSQVFNIKRV